MRGEKRGPGWVAFCTFADLQKGFSSLSSLIYIVYKRRGEIDEVGEIPQGRGDRQGPGSTALTLQFIRWAVEESYLISLGICQFGLWPSDL